MDPGVILPDASVDGTAPRPAGQPDAPACDSAASDGDVVCHHLLDLAALHQNATQRRGAGGVRSNNRGGGVLFVCMDITESPGGGGGGAAEWFALLGMSHGGAYSTFGGWIDVNETVEQGCAREAWEESRGVVGDQCDLWRCVALCPRYARLLPSKDATRWTYVVNLGPTDAARRAAVEARFSATRGWDECSLEVKHVRFFPLRVLRDHATTNPVGSFFGRASDNERGSVLRQFLHKWLAQPSLWNSATPWMEGMLHGSSGGPCRSISELPPLDAASKSALPFASKKCAQCFHPERDAN